MYGIVGKELARLGVRVILPEFRNSVDGHVFPAALHDCYSTVVWASTRYNESVLVSGESGGGNLAIATCLLAKKKKNIRIIKGCYALCPFICGSYPSSAFPSIAYYQNYLCSISFLSDCARLYTADDDADAATSSLAWPSYATIEELKDLPPTLIHINELDLLYDEGVQFYRSLLAAGNKGARMNVVGGTFHAADTFSGLMEDIAHATRVSVVQFALECTSDGGSSSDDGEQSSSSNSNTLCMGVKKSTKPSSGNLSCPLPLNWALVTSFGFGVIIGGVGGLMYGVFHGMHVTFEAFLPQPTKKN